MCIHIRKLVSRAVPLKKRVEMGLLINKVFLITTLSFIITRMSIQLEISPRIIPSIATLYNDTNRIFMEYIDNSLDSAESFFDKETNSYKKNILIELKITWESHKTWQVSIIDNCTWITNFTKVVQSIGNSDKKEQPRTNGQFWYGVYSFMAACEKLDITSKLMDHNALYIPINRKQFEAEKQGDVQFPDPEEVEYIHESWTEVILSDFDKDKRKKINIWELKIEIETHFELLLDRKNLEIRLVNQLDEVSICKAFNYNNFEGYVYEDYISTLFYTEGRKYPIKQEMETTKPIHIFLKFTKNKTIDKPPIFIIKWRRIWEIKNIKLFRSKYKSEIWWHPNMTWYIDLSDYLEPTIARDDFKNNDKTKALFNTLYELETVILDEIKNINKESESQHYRTLEDKLNKALSRLAKIDAMNFRTEYLSWSEINLEKWGSGLELQEWYWQKDYWNNKNETDTWSPYWTNEWEWYWPTGETWNDISQWWENEWELWSNKEKENPFEDSEFKWWEQKKSWFNITFVDGEPQKDINDRLLRSQVIWGNIRIFKEHPDFEERVKKSLKGEIKVTQRLITYLAWEITVHYKDKLQTRYWQPEYDKKLFQDLVEFIYQFESMLKDLDGMNLSDF